MPCKAFHRLIKQQNWGFLRYLFQLPLISYTAHCNPELSRIPPCSLPLWQGCELAPHASWLVCTHWWAELVPPFQKSVAQVFLSWGFSFVTGSSPPAYPQRDVLEQGGRCHLTTQPYAFVRQLHLCEAWILSMYSRWKGKLAEPLWRITSGRIY